jgi:hypothetical protein
VAQTVIPPCTAIFWEAAFDKAQIMSKVEALTEGTVILGIPDELAWTIYIDGQDSGSIGRLVFVWSIPKY